MNVRRVFASAAVYVGSGGIGTLAGILVSLPFHGIAYAVAWIGTGTVVAAGCGLYADRLAERKGWL